MLIDKYKQELIDLHNQKNELRKSLEVSSTDSIVDCAYLMRDIDVRIHEIKEKLLLNQNQMIVSKKIAIKEKEAAFAEYEEIKDIRQNQRDKRLRMLKRFKRTCQVQDRQLQAWRGAAVGSLTVIATAILLYLFFII